MPSETLTRLSKWIADSGYCSRRAACRLIEAGHVNVNGLPGKHTDRVSANDVIHVEQHLIQPFPELEYQIYNKPVGIDCVCSEEDPDSIIHQLKGKQRVFPAGRLDKDSHGLLLLTNDGALCQKILHPDFFHEKEYCVVVDKAITPLFCLQMAQGVEYNGTRTRPCKIIQTDTHTFLITLTQGMNRQIRKMCRSLGYTVTHLQRTRLVNLQLDGLSSGTFRDLTSEEVKTLKNTLRPNRPDELQETAEAISKQSSSGL
ncbi:pseudouridine synthase [Endozoicomonas numazuensis]|uniref:pseudouridine synthase n=1 Tax=Endozoicomonas numazuensis TaxID=1137799 RepID=UPI000AFF1040|nr:pseudouridine synthase [Endozoicomonas numazuensis]